MFHCSQQRQSEGMPMISIGNSLTNRHRQSIHENFDIQLPLIEANRPRVIFLFFIFFYLNILCYIFSQYQEILHQEEQPNHFGFYLSNVDEILL
jgi:hypothetical protein